MNEKDRIYDQTISIREFFLHLLRHWRLMVLLALVGGILIGAYTAFSTWKAYRAGAYPALSAAKLEEVQHTIEANEESIKNNQKDMTRITLEVEEMEDLAKVYDQVLAKSLQVQDPSESFIADILSLTARIADLRFQVTTSENELETLQEANIDLEEANIELEDSTKAMITPQLNIRDTMKSIIIGLAGGVALAVVIALFRVGIRGTLRSREELEMRYGYHILACLYCTQSRLAPGKKQCLVDRWISQLAGEPEQVDTAAAYALMAAKLTALTTGSQKLIITGTAKAEKLEQVKEALALMLDPEVYNLDTAADPLSNPASILKMKDAHLILVEEIRISRSLDMVRLAEYLQASHAQVLGAVAL